MTQAVTDYNAGRITKAAYDAAVKADTDAARAKKTASDAFRDAVFNTKADEGKRDRAKETEGKHRASLDAAIDEQCNLEFDLGQLKNELAVLQRQLAAADKGTSSLDRITTDSSANLELTV